MSLIYIAEIKKLLVANGFEYQLVNAPLTEEFQVASLFAPVPNGFYYFTGSSFPDSIVDSLVLVNEELAAANISQKNAWIVVKSDPQATYYKLLGDLFGRASNGTVSEYAVVHPDARIGRNVQIDPFSVIGNCTIEDDCMIGSHCVLHDKTWIGNATIVEPQSVLGAQGVAWTWNNDQTEKIVQPQLGGVRIGQRCFLGAHTVIVRGSLNENTQIGDNCLLAPGSRIGHGTKIGNYVHFANNIITGGNTIIGDHSFVGSAAVFRPRVKIDERTIVGAGAVVVKNTSDPGLTLMGVPAQETKTKANPSGMPKPKRG